MIKILSKKNGNETKTLEAITTNTIIHGLQSSWRMVSGIILLSDDRTCLCLTSPT